MMRKYRQQRNAAGRKTAAYSAAAAKKSRMGRLCAVIFLAVCAGAGSTVPSWAGQAVVEDQAELLNREELAELEEQAEELAKDTGYDIMLITTDDAEGKEAVDYAEDFYMDHKTALPI